MEGGLLPAQTNFGVGQSDNKGNFRENQEGQTGRVRPSHQCSSQGGGNLALRSDSLRDRAEKIGLSGELLTLQTERNRTEITWLTQVSGLEVLGASITVPWPLTSKVQLFNKVSRAVEKFSRTRNKRG